ncbi:MAG TPA: aminomethyl-transferring glycine dehydrogenase subunit GcvPA [Polyangiaceae bacterium]|nr:aminomethyl-transferring glycine dehydrogenase subunit GcvPA [Polyangiaceae bacterium]
MRYLPHTPEEVQAMLAAVGRGHLDELFLTIPEEARFAGHLEVPPALDEPRLMAHLASLAEKSNGASMLSFLGGGMYDHHIPPAVDQLLLRSEFYTAYTPYQPEVAQGTLQAIWEFQTIVSELLGLPLANASLYDGASATAEAALMARRLTKRSKVLVSHCVHPDYRDSTRTYLTAQVDAYVEVEAAKDGGVDIARITTAIDDDTAAVIVGYPSFFGTISDLRKLAEAAHAKGCLLVTATSEPYALALIESPGALGADIAVGEGQALACGPNFGGPGVGLFACRGERNYLQQLPGRLCGETVDANGKRGYVLTLSPREQHIRRERATSNICTNQGLLALSFLIRASLLGKQGFVRVAEHCAAKARYLKTALMGLDGYTSAIDTAPFFNEFTVRVRGGDAARVCNKLAAQGVLAGVDLGRFENARKDQLLIAVTEKHARADLDRLVSLLDAI